MKSWTERGTLLDLPLRLTYDTLMNRKLSFKLNLTLLSAAILFLLVQGITCQNVSHDEMYKATWFDLSSVPQDIPSGVKLVYLDHNNISFLDSNSFPNLTECTRLSLRDNPLSEIRAGAFREMSSLEELKLKSCEMEDLGGEMWEGLESLKVLGLSYNKLKVIRGEMWQGLLSLESLDLQGNHITTLHEGAFSPLKSLKELFLW